MKYGKIHLKLEHATRKEINLISCFTFIIQVNCRGASMGGKRVTTEKFIERSVEIHGDTYGYDKSIYAGSKDRIIIKCKKHGYFEQLPYNHLKGKGCPKCAIENSSIRYMHSNEEVLRKFKKVHGDRYDYSLVEYNGCKNKVKIICKSHGIFKQDANAHAVGKGCDKCARQVLNYRKSDYVELCNRNHNGKSNFYILEMKEDNDQSFFKIGITTQKLKYRYRKNDMPYNYKIVRLINADAEKVFNVELSIKKLMLNEVYKPQKSFAGSRYECFTHIPDNIFEMIDCLV